VEEQPGTSCFKFTKECHREIRFMREAELREFAKHLIRERDQRTRGVTREEVRQYIAQRFASSNEEWKQLGSKKPEWKQWTSKQAKPLKPERTVAQPTTEEPGSSA
jgi:hypothetical protein